MDPPTRLGHCVERHSLSGIGVGSGVHTGPGRPGPSEAARGRLAGGQGMRCGV